MAAGAPQVVRERVSTLFQRHAWSAASARIVPRSVRQGVNTVRHACESIVECLPGVSSRIELHGWVCGVYFHFDVLLPSCRNCSSIDSGVAGVPNSGRAFPLMRPWYPSGLTYGHIEFFFLSGGCGACCGSGLTGLRHPVRSMSPQYAACHGYSGRSWCSPGASPSHSNSVRCRILEVIDGSPYEVAYHIGQVCCRAVVLAYTSRG